METNGPGPGLTPDEINTLTDQLKAGQYLPDYLRDRLFQSQQEAELAYGGKTSRSQVLSETMAVPLQTVKRFGESSDGWTDKLIFGDNLQVLKELLEMKGRGELMNADGSEGVRLCYIDPPFATKREFQAKKGQVAYRDKVEGAEFVEFLRKRLILIYELLADDGSLYLHLDTKQGHYLKVALDEIFGPESFKADITWKRTNARRGGDAWPRVHDMLLVYSKGGTFRYRPIEIPADKQKLPHTLITGPDGAKYQTYELTAPGETKAGESGQPWRGIPPPAGRHWADGHKRMDEWDEAGLIHWPKKGGFPRRRDEEPFDPEARTVFVGDVWTDIDRINQAAKERVGYPTQKPEALLDRILTTSSAEGDIVLDCFVGSGTAALVAERLARRWIAVDSGKLAIYTTQGRLLEEAGQGGGEPSLSTGVAFDVCTAGLYDNELLEELQPDDYRSFGLELFGCRPGPHEIGGIEMAGRRSGDPVHVFPYAETDADMGREYVDSLEGRLRGLHSGPCYVIAPASRCDPGLFEDVIEVGAITFFILRIPYSVIEALHQRRFEKLRQPTEAEAINDPIDAFGFDFVRVPEVKASYKLARNSFSGEITSFYRGDLDPDDRASIEDAGRRRSRNGDARSRLGWRGLSDFRLLVRGQAGGGWLEVLDAASGMWRACSPDLHRHAWE